MTELDAAAHVITVLVVDDSDDQRALLTKNFERAGCSVTDVSTAEDAIDRLLTVSPDVVVVDLILPGITGWELTERISRDHPECFVVVTSVLDPSQYPDNAAILPKPFTGKQIRELLEKFVPRWSTP